MFTPALFGGSALTEVVYVVGLMTLVLVVSLAVVFAATDTVLTVLRRRNPFVR